jgi:DNA-binding IclR family transcriptional regulator
MNHASVVHRSRAAMRDCALLEVIRSNPGTTINGLSELTGLCKTSVYEKARLLRMAGLVTMNRPVQHYQLGIRQPWEVYPI